MKRILFFHQNLVIGGAETILTNYLKLLSTSDNEIHLFLVEKPNQECLEQIPSNIIIHTFFNEKIESLYHSDLKQVLIDKTLEKFSSIHFDMLINFNGHFDFFLERYSLNIPVVRWIHGMLHFSYWKNNLNYYRHILSQHTHLIAINQEIAYYCQIFIKETGLEHLKVFKVYNPIDSEKILACTEELINDKPYLLQVGRLDPYKNHHQLINIYAKLKQLGIKEKLYIVGDGECYAALKEHINCLGLQQDCLLLGELSNPYPIMKSAKLFLHTSLTEGLPTVLIESMVCNVPVIAMDCMTGPREILNNGEYGVLVELKNEDQFVEKTVELLNNPKLIDDFKSKFPEALARFSFDAIRQEINMIFKNILND